MIVKISTNQNVKNSGKKEVARWCNQIERNFPLIHQVGQFYRGYSHKHMTEGQRALFNVGPTISFYVGLTLMRHTDGEHSGISLPSS